MNFRSGPRRSATLPWMWRSQRPCQTSSFATVVVQLPVSSPRSSGSDAFAWSGAGPPQPTIAAATAISKASRMTDGAGRRGPGIVRRSLPRVDETRHRRTRSPRRPPCDASGDDPLHVTGDNRQDIPRTTPSATREVKTCPATRSPSSAPATSAPRQRSGSPRPVSPTSSWSTSSRGCRRARASTSPRPRPSSATTPRIDRHQRLRGRRPARTSSSSPRASPASPA